MLAMFKELSKNTFIQLVQLLADILFLGTLQLKFLLDLIKVILLLCYNGGVYLEKANYAQYRGEYGEHITEGLTSQVQHDSE